ncbi:hypothetical protein [Cardinium endosymbiont of Nabis limbatus]|uniref:hypothetical protein n=1 Tax=Cardinium endosymbiont of Nabis limbatus TaxID=3066217 RepID=UPI003AF3B74A
MKIKIALFGLFFANSIVHPIYADEPQVEEDEIELFSETQEEKEGAPANELEEDELNSKNLIKLGTTITMNPALIYQDDTLSSKNSVGAELKFSADVPKAWCNKDATANISGAWDAKEFNIKSAALSIGKMVTIGCSSTIFGYEKADSALIISGKGTVLQVKGQHAFNWFRLGYALEKPIGLEVGLFDKHKSEPEENSDPKDRTNKFDKSDNKERPFKIKNNWPAFGLSLGGVTDGWNIGLSGLFRCTDYTYGTHSNEGTSHFITYGGNLGIQYQIVPKKLTTTVQVIGVYGLGDYVSGLSAIQGDKEREEMCAAYYTDKEKDELSAINAWGAGGTLAYCVTPKWTVSIAGSYLTTLENSDKPAQAFTDQWHIAPKVAYEVNKYFTLSLGYNGTQERRVKKAKEKGFENKVSAGIKFSL